jgi:hypothetical protein
MHTDCIDTAPTPPPTDWDALAKITPPHIQPDLQRARELGAAADAAFATLLNKLADVVLTRHVQSTKGGTA